LSDYSQNPTYKGAVWKGEDKWDEIPNSSKVIDLTETQSSIAEGPYILGSGQSTGKLWAYNGGSFPSVDLGVQLTGGVSVVTRAISNSLVIPAGDSIWRNSRVRKIADLCGNPKDWSEFTARFVSPNNNLLLADAKKGGTLHRMLLVPLEIKQTNYPTTTDTTDLGPTIEKSISTDGSGIAYITGASEMPQLEASIGSGSLSGMTVEWRLDVKTERTPERGTKDDFKIPATGTTSVSIDQPWKIYESFTAPHDFFGGKVSIFYRIKKNSGGYLTDEQEIKFKIHGKNPKDADAKSYIQSTSEIHRYAWAMAQHESRQDEYGSRVYNQFNAGGSTKEIPNFSGNYPDEDGWGMAQLDRPLGVSATTAEVYSWHQNMSKFYAELDGKKSDAERFIRWIKNLWGSDSRWEEPPTSWPISASSFSPVELATIVLYNGASGIPTSNGKDDNGAPRSFLSPWTFDPTKSAGQRWEFHDNTNPVNHLHYAATVIQDEWEHGQPTSE
jgi:hypothetical protein